MVISADWPLIATPGIIWGASFLFIAEGLKAIAPSGVSFIRLFVGVATLAMFPAARKQVERSAWPAIALVGVLWFAFPLSMFPFAEQRVSSALTGMLNAAVPLFTAIVATVMAGRIPERRVLAGLAIGLIGAGLIAWPTIHDGHSSFVGVLLILAAMVSYGLALNLARPLQQQYGALPVVLRAQAVAVMFDRTARYAGPARCPLDACAFLFAPDAGSIRHRNRICVGGDCCRQSRGHTRVVGSVLDSSGRPSARSFDPWRICRHAIDHRQRSLRGGCVAHAPRSDQPSA